MISNFNIYIIFIFLLSIIGCSSSGPIINYKLISVPDLNQVTTASLGDSLLTQAKGIMGYKRIEISSAFGYYSRIEPGIYCQLNKNSNLYFSPNPKAVTFTSPNGQVHGYNNKVGYDQDNKRICPGGGNPCYDSSEISIIELGRGPCLTSKSFQQTIEYSGKHGNILNFVYREFMDSMIRSGFTTNFTIDLSEGNSLTYKGAKIKIENATNNKITYKVLKNFN